MSTQKRQVSVGMPYSFAEYPARQNDCYYKRLSEPIIKEDKYACKRLRKHRHYKILLRNGSTSSTDVQSSYRHRKSNRQRKKIHVSESALLKEKIRELDILRKKIELIEKAITTQNTDTEEPSEINLRKSQSCFSFLNLLASKKHVSKPEIVRLLTTTELNKHIRPYLNKKEQPSNKIHNEICNSSGTDLKFMINNQKKSMKTSEKENFHNISQQYRFTNDNNMVSQECYAQLPRTTKEQLLYLNDKLELQNVEIQKIKEKLEECIELLKYHSNINMFNGMKSFNLDDYININKVASKLSSSNLFNMISRGMENYEKKKLPQTRTSAENLKSALRKKTATFTNTSTSILHSTSKLDGSDIVYKNTKSSVIVKVSPAHGKSIPVRNDLDVSANRKERSSRKKKHKTSATLPKQKKTEVTDLNENRSYIVRFVRFFLCKHY